MVLVEKIYFVWFIDIRIYRIDIVIILCCRFLIYKHWSMMNITNWVGWILGQYVAIFGREALFKITFNYRWSFVLSVLRHAILGNFSSSFFSRKSKRTMKVVKLCSWPVFWYIDSFYGNSYFLSNFFFCSVFEEMK